MSSYTVLVNQATNTEIRLYTGEVTPHELAQVDARRGDVLQVVEVAYELVQNGYRMVAGSTVAEPIMVQREVSRTVVREWKQGRK